MLCTFLCHGSIDLLWFRVSVLSRQTKLRAAISQVCGGCVIMSAPHKNPDWPNKLCPILRVFRAPNVAHLAGKYLARVRAKMARFDLRRPEWLDWNESWKVMEHLELPLLIIIPYTHEFPEHEGKEECSTSSTCLHKSLPHLSSPDGISVLGARPLPLHTVQSACFYVGLELRLHCLRAQVLIQCR